MIHPALEGRRLTRHCKALQERPFGAITRSFGTLAILSGAEQSEEREVTAYTFNGSYMLSCGRVNLSDPVIQTKHYLLEMLHTIGMGY